MNGVKKLIGRCSRRADRPMTSAAHPAAAKGLNGAEQLLHAALDAGIEVCFANPGALRSKRHR